MPAGPGEDHRRQISRDRKSISAVVFAQSKWKFERGNRGAGGRSVVQGLTEDGGLSVGGERIEERFAVRGVKPDPPGGALWTLPGYKNNA